MKSFAIRTHKEPEMAVTRFRWQTDSENNAVLSWTWPENEEVKYMLVAATDRETDDPFKWLMQDPGRHTVVTRNLSARYQAPIGEGRKRYIIAPAYLRKKDVVVYGPAHTTSWLYPKAKAEVRLACRAIPFSKYKRVKFSLHLTDPNDAELAKAALRYALYERNYPLGFYPLDDALLTGGYMFIKKNQHISFIIEETHAHLIMLA